MYNKETCTGGLFAEHINIFSEIKTRAAVCLLGVRMKMTCNRYIREYYEHEGILLEKTKIQRNTCTGQRALAKLMTNSMWDKFAQRDNFPQLQYIRQPEEFLHFLRSEHHWAVLFKALFRDEAPTVIPFLKCFYKFFF